MVDRILEQLKSEALDSCEMRHHKMKPWKTIDHISVKSSCENCGKKVFVTAQPMPNDTDISGEAVALNCPQDPNRPMSPDAAGKVVLIAVKIGYPGSHISGILIGGHKMLVSNADLRAAAALAADPAGSYDMSINTELYLGAAGDIDEDDE